MNSEQNTSPIWMVKGNIQGACVTYEGSIDIGSKMTCQPIRLSCILPATIGTVPKLCVPWIRARFNKFHTQNTSRLQKTWIGDPIRSHSDTWQTQRNIFENMDILLCWFFHRYWGDKITACVSCALFCTRLVTFMSDWDTITYHA